MKYLYRVDVDGDHEMETFGADELREMFTEVEREGLDKGWTVRTGDHTKWVDMTVLARRWMGVA